MPRPALPTLLAPVLALCLGACNAQFQGSADTSRPQVPSRLADPLSGNFKGQAYLSALSTSPGCPGSSIGKIAIGDRKLYFAYLPGVLFVAPLADDGSLHATSGISVLDGSLVDGHLLFTVRTPVCASTYDMNWVL